MLPISPLRSKAPPLPTLFLTLGFVVSLLATAWTLYVGLREQECQFADDAALAFRELNVRFHRGLRSTIQARGFFEAQPDGVTETEFDSYAQGVQDSVGHAFPMGFGFARKFSDSYEVRFSKGADPSHEAHGASDVLWLNPKLRTAVLQASIDSGLPGYAVTESPHVSEEPIPAENRHIIFFEPVYRGGNHWSSTELHRTQHVGFAFIDLSIPHAFGSISSAIGLSDLRIKLRSQNDDGINEIFFSHKPREPSVWSRELTADNTLMVGLQPLKISIQRSTSYLSAPILIIPLMTLLGCLFMTGACYRIIRENHLQKMQILNSDLQLRLVTDSLPVLISYIDRHRRYRFVSRTYEEWFGIERDRIVGHLVEEIVGTAHHAKTGQHLTSALAGESVSYETILETTDGRVRPILVHKVPDLDPRGQVRGVISLVVDISERKFEEERNRRAAEISNALGSSSDLQNSLQTAAQKLSEWFCDVCIVDIFGAGQSPMRAIGWTPAEPSEALKKTIASFDSRSLHSSPLFLPNAEGFNCEPVRSLISVPLRSREQIVGTITCLMLEPSLKHFCAKDFDFAQELGWRTGISIENLRLLNEAQKANRAKDEFLATLSHELRTPMNVILGWLEILSTEDYDPTTLQQALSALNRNAKMQFQLINDLIDISGIVSGHLVLSPKLTDLRQLALVAAESLRPLAKDQGIQLTVHEADGDWQMFADADRIKQIIWNLLSNALKFTPPSGHVDVRFAGSGDALRLEISDTGAGIDPTFLPHVFDRFRQEDGSCSRTHGGLGIGLAIVRHLIESHGGRVEATSAGRGQGACFVLHCPRSMSLKSVDQISSNAATVQRTQPPREVSV
jgi:PAS domain S-box-containing protein